jgi:EAL domain-containing protein (putative c-di-GMP-specific phosphodiesterase class I)/CheY-like chemotaxis protein
MGMAARSLANGFPSVQLDAMHDSAPAEPSSQTTDLTASCRGTVLLVDDDPILRRSLARLLESDGYEVRAATDGQDAVDQVDGHSLDALLSDISMPKMGGIQLLRKVRDQDPNVPVVLITGQPAVGTAAQALEYGAFAYLTKPVEADALRQVLAKAVRTRRMLACEQAAAELLCGGAPHPGSRAGLEASLQRAMGTLWIAYHPIVRADSSQVFGYEALLRSDEPALGRPRAMVATADRLGLVHELGRTVRERAAIPFAHAPATALLFINLHPSDLLDPLLTSPAAPLSKLAARVVLEVTDRSSIHHIKDLPGHVRQLREMGFRIAIDDLGAGYAGLNSFAQLEPEFVKLDMTLVRNVHSDRVKRRIVRSLASLAKEMGIATVAEGIETVEERDAVVELGCDLLQGSFFARPKRPSSTYRW